MNMLAISLCVWSHFPLLSLYFWSLAVVCLFCMTETLFLPPIPSSSDIFLYFSFTPALLWPNLLQYLYIFFFPKGNILYWHLTYLTYVCLGFIFAKNCMQCKAGTVHWLNTVSQLFQNDSLNYSSQYLWLIFSVVSWTNNFLLKGYMQYHFTTLWRHFLLWMSGICSSWSLMSSVSIFLKSTWMSVCQHDCLKCKKKCKTESLHGFGV